MTLEIRFYRRTDECNTTGLIIPTPFDDLKKAIKFATEKFNKTNHSNKWKIDKGFIKRQIKN